MTLVPANVTSQEAEGVHSSDMEAIWHRLARVTKIRFRVMSRGNAGSCSGTGRGDVQVLVQHRHALVLTESGSWNTESGARLAFWNRYRWTFRPEPQRLTLEHLRYGEHNPEKLLTFERWERQHLLVPGKPYFCGKDRYSATLKQTLQGLSLCWRISGPDKNHETRSEYR